MPIGIIGKKYNYKWKETKTVNSGSNTFTLTNSVPVGGVLKIYDQKFGIEWFSPQHWTISGSTVSLTETSLYETLTFDIYCFV